MAATAQATKNQITLKGSVATVAEFFSHALSSILYQRGIYAPESFEPRKAYGLTVMAVKDDKLAAYLSAVLKQFESALAGGQPGCLLGLRMAALQRWAGLAAALLVVHLHSCCLSMNGSWLPASLLLVAHGASPPFAPPICSTDRRVAGGRRATEGGAGHHGGGQQGGAGAVDL